MFRKYRLLLLFIVLLFAAPLTFFAGFEAFSRHLEAELKFDASRANAAKHAYAAGEIYNALHMVGISAATSERIVLNLGEVNEYLETIFKISEPDSTREIMKDMYNNQAGVLAAQWVCGKEDMSLRDVIIRLAQQNVLAVSSYTIPHSGPEKIEDYPQSVEHASGWFYTQQTTIKATVNKGLAKGE